jgi:hypothetical protein
MRMALTWFNVALRGVMELGIVLALAYWGYHTGGSTLAKVALAVGAPALGFGFWGLVDFHQAGRMAEPLRLVQELVISGLAAVALVVAGQPALGWALGLISIAHHALVYGLGQRLLKE